MYSRILVPLEKEGATEAHVQHASALAAKIDAELILLRVVTVISDNEYFLKQVQIEEGSSGAKRKAEAEDYVTRLTENLRDEGVSVKSEVIVSDKAEDEAIVEYATESNCQLIVLPNQRRSLVSRWLQGNVTAKVQRRSHIPILLVRVED